MEPQPKTIEEHRDYLYGIVRLKLFFLHGFLNKHPEEKFADALRNRVDIYRKTSANRGLLNPTEFFYDVEPWVSMECKAGELFELYKNDVAAFENAAFEVFKPSIDERLEKDFADKSGLAGYQCGSIRHEYEKRHDPDTIHFHIANAVCPHSIFDDPNHLRDCLLQLCDHVEKDLGATKVACGTWLNQNPKWLHYFPQEWRDHMSAPNTDVHWHYGFWGQFISARGTLNRKYEKYLRETGELPHYPCGSWCTVESLRAHLLSL